MLKKNKLLDVDVRLGLQLLNLISVLRKFFISNYNNYIGNLCGNSVNISSLKFTGPLITLVQSHVNVARLQLLPSLCTKTDRAADAFEK